MRIIEMEEFELQKLLNEAAHHGAKAALKEIGLDDEKAVHDIRDLRDLLAAWKMTTRSMWSTAVKITTAAVLTALAAGLYLRS